MRRGRLNPLSLLFMAAMVCSQACWMAAWADCQSDYDKAMSQLAQAKQQALDPNAKKLDTTAFMADFQEVMDRLQKNRCSTEIMRILEHVKLESQFYPAPGAN